MKNILFLMCVMTLNFGLSQVGIGTTSPNEMLEVNGSIRMTDGNQAEGKVMVSDLNGTGSWQALNDISEVKSAVIRSVNGGNTTEVVLWTHPKGIEVRFLPGEYKVRVENKSGDSSHYWDVVIHGGGQSNATSENAQYMFKYLIDDGNSSNELISYDIDPNDLIDRGWFEVIASDQNNTLSGFTLKVIYYFDDINGMVQYWDHN